MKNRGRPRKSHVDRAEQLRRAKRAQRAREKAAGLADIQLRLPEAQVRRLRAAANSSVFKNEMDRFLNDVVLDVQHWPRLRELTWNRKDRWIPANEAFALYERNWRFVEGQTIDAEEAALIDRLKLRYGSGVLNA